VNDYDKDNDGRLDPQELLSWVVPNNQGIAQEEVSTRIPSSHCVTEGRASCNLDPRKKEMELFKMGTLFCFELNDKTLSY
jgi:Ca2+-binding EF-hand superfamily protein